jgi:hypothetical protein
VCEPYSGSWAQADRAPATALVPIAHTVMMTDERSSRDLLSVLIWLLFVFFYMNLLCSF